MSDLLVWFYVWFVIVWALGLLGVVVVFSVAGLIEWLYQRQRRKIE